MEFRWKDHKQQEIIKCACGCGEEMEKYYKDVQGYIRERQYIVGHCARLGNSGQFEKGHSSWNVGIPMKEESKEKLRQAALEQFKDGMSEEDRIKVSCGLRGIDVEDFDGF